MEQVAHMRTAPNELTQIIFTTGDSVQVQETVDEIHQKMGVPSVRSEKVGRLRARRVPPFTPLASAVH
jgi:hypothetical protein